MTHLSYVINELYSVHATIRMLLLYHLNRIRCLLRIAYLKLSCISHTFNISISRNDITHHEFVVLSLTTTRNADSRRVK